MNKTIEKTREFFSRPFFSNPKTLFWLWIGLGLISALTKFHKCNNFLIFKYVFWHTWNGTPLYEAYPAEYFDVNHYGPLFSLVIAPFAVLPHPLGLIFWHVILALLLYLSIRKLPMEQGKQILILWFCAHELLTALFMSQFNIAIAAIIVASYYFIERERESTAAFFHCPGYIREIIRNSWSCIFLLLQAQGPFCALIDRVVGRYVPIANAH